mmetsp:Transcript_17697/g.30938  ORF Transcript_17697/g.30938 Transcript_17697/m.30938 type:complete len:99 (-) Transcript_17697:1620-1916(-)
MVFGIQKLQDEIFCLTEERDYFQAKFLEQVSEIQALKAELSKSKREVEKLRNELLQIHHVVQVEQVVKKTGGARRLRSRQRSNGKDDDDDDDDSVSKD